MANPNTIQFVLAVGKSMMPVELKLAFEALPLELDTAKPPVELKKMP